MGGDVGWGGREGIWWGRGRRGGGVSAEDFETCGEAEDDEPEHEVARLCEDAFVGALDVIEGAACGDSEGETAFEGVWEGEEGAEVAPEADGDEEEL